jgi:hypothetical protein
MLLDKQNDYCCSATNDAIQIFSNSNKYTDKKGKNIKQQLKTQLLFHQ